MLNLKSWVLQFKQDAPQCLRLRRMSIALLGAFVLSGISIAFYTMGIFRASYFELVLLLSCFWAINLGFLLTLLIGLNKKLADPSMTKAQMIWAISSTMVVVYFSNELRPVVLMMNLLILLFGSFYLDSKSENNMVLFSIIGYVVVIVLLLMTPQARVNLTREIVVLCVYSLIAISYTSLTLELIGLRRYARKKEFLLKESVEKIKKLSLTDYVTEIGNRRFILEVLNREIAVSSRNRDHYFSISMLDIDHFKKVNDTFGHNVGDKVLQELCVVINGVLRKTDYFARIGGEEFLIVSPDTNQEQAKITAERIRSSVEKAILYKPLPNLKITVSIGICPYVFPETVDDVLRKADKALYLAKNNGRNKVGFI